MRCTDCDSALPDNARFCPDCGKKQGKRCAKCGEKLEPSHRFCPDCGQAVSAGDDDNSAPPKSRFGHTPEHLAKRILRSRSAIEGERKQVTVLFADITDSTRMIEDLDPELAVKHFEPVIKVMMDAVHRYEGTVNRIQGDGIMALFGAPLAHEDHALRACFAALQIQEVLRSASNESPRVRVGLHTGEVVVRALRNDLSLDYEADGIAVHVANRMEQLADPGTVCISADTFHLVEGHVNARIRRQVPIKGIAEPMDIYELVSIPAGRIRWYYRESLGLSSFIGRDKEMRTLVQKLEKSEQGQSQLVAVVGEPGNGKSRLVHEFLNSDATDGWNVLEASGMSHGKRIAYLPIANLLRSWFDIDESDSQSEIARKAHDKLVDISEDLLEIKPALFSILDVPVDDNAWQMLNAEQRRRQHARAVSSLILHAAEKSPLVLLFEDLNWVDEDSDVVLNSIIDGMGQRQLMVLVSYRPEYKHDWETKSFYSGIRAEALPSTFARTLLDNLLGMDESLNALKAQLVERTGGTPLFLEEIVRAMAEAGSLQGDAGHYRLAAGIDSITIPNNLQAVLAGRIDQLTPEEKDLLHVASVLGQEFSFNLLRAVSALSEADLEKLLSQLQRKEFIYQSRLLPHPEFRFRHSLTHDVAYDSVLRSRRTALHAELVDQMEEIYGDRIDEHVERLAQHAFRGERWAEAVHYSRRAAERATSHSAYREAIMYLKNGLAANRALPVSRRSRQAEADIRCSLANALLTIGEFEDTVECLDEAQSLAEDLDDDARQSAALTAKTIALSQSGDIEEAIECGVRAHTLAKRSMDTELLVSSGYALGEAYQFSGRCRRSAEILSESLQQMMDGLEYHRFGPAAANSVHVLSTLSITHALLGEFEAAIGCGEQACRIAEDSNQFYELGFAKHAIGIAYADRGDFANGITYFREGMKIARDFGVDFLFPMAATELGYALALAGETDDGERLLRAGIAHAQHMGSLFFQGLAHAYLASAYLVSGQFEKTIDYCEQSLAIAVAQNYRWLEVMARRTLGCAYFEQAKPEIDRAREMLQAARQLCETHELKPDLAHCHFGLGRLHAAENEEQEAVTHLSEAARLYDELKMSYWRDEVQPVLRGFQTAMSLP